MKKAKLTLLSLSLLGSVCLSSCYVDLGFIQFGEKPAETPSTPDTPAKPSTDPIDVKDGDADPYTGNYYDSISDSLSGTELLSALRKLNKAKRKSTVGYKNMGTSASGAYKYTDYDISDPSKLKRTSSGQIYGTTIVSFYSGNTMSTFNREHVWPNTHGGHLVEDDIHMTRPTIVEENSARGHSFYIENMKSESNDGWDPAMESFGKESYRGDAARIIFYCMIATDSLTLVDDGSRSSRTNNYEMGVISDMISWNARYPVQQREQRRNSGAEYLQQNRNPFIDHPEYACKIWGSSSAKAKTACQNANYPIA